MRGATSEVTGVWTHSGDENDTCSLYTNRNLHDLRMHTSRRALYLGKHTHSHELLAYALYARLEAVEYSTLLHTIKPALRYSVQLWQMLCDYMIMLNDSSVATFGDVSADNSGETYTQRGSMTPRTPQRGSDLPELLHGTSALHSQNGAQHLPTDFSTIKHQLMTPPNPNKLDPIDKQIKQLLMATDLHTALLCPCETFAGVEDIIRSVTTQYLHVGSEDAITDVDNYLASQELMYR
ncbi:hypothetical protein Hypma_016215 [Hypsizygus marmoreus]|uniref:Uncharacterized protein n=1 Tax=Hypsizygus marmoreus TaxID=39966 RepID=A0A369J107_HYPMA|nr:hypothetical protein Hypma_016215 [Hypsizygus marmoreus]